MKKYSILGLSLLAVSAITAAFIPAQKSNAAGQVAGNGHMTQSTGNQPDKTCRAPITGDALNCSYTQTGNNNLNVGFSSTSANVVDSHSITGTQLAVTLSATEPTLP
ncbi:hypothetical protein [Chitinophaga sp. 22620]|uniref:hypothetical protein n=1 Tax=Chitinophaga sp. 22620 TaxID=3453952 RepID=UPI003F8780EE